MRRIWVVVGSDSDLLQCTEGIEYLQSEGRPVQVWTMSIHRNTQEVLEFLSCRSHWSDADILIVGAGWANHLTGTCDAYLRHTLRDDRIVVIGVAFEDHNSQIHTLAAELSITEVPGTQVAFKDESDEVFVGADGFLRACKFAVNGELPQIKLPDLRPPHERSLQATLDFIRKKENQS